MKTSCKNILHERHSESYRFRRWTGHAWAVFNSLKRHIEIGFLSTDITTVLGVKSALLKTPDSIQKQWDEVEDKGRQGTVNDLFQTVLYALLIVVGQLYSMLDVDLRRDTPVAPELTPFTNPSTFPLIFFIIFFCPLHGSVPYMISLGSPAGDRFCCNVHQLTADSR